MELIETTRSQKRIYEGLIVNVRQDEISLHNGKSAKREVVEHPGGVAVFALDQEERVVMVRQFRYPMGEVLWELPAGKLEPGEDPRLCALRELKEETGIVPRQFHPLGCIYASPGVFAEKIYLFLASDLEQGEAKPDEDEFLDVQRLPLKTLLSMIAHNEIPDGKTMAGTLRALLFLEKV